MKKIFALANERDPDQTRSKAGSFSAEASDATSTAYKASAQAHADGTPESHDRAAKLNRSAAKRHADEGNADNAALHESIAKGHEMLSGTSHPALANEFYFAEERDGNFRIALDNAIGLDDDGWGLIAPFGEHPKTRLFRENGQIKEQQFIQVLDNDAADAMLGKENSFFGKLKRALVGIPVYKGHGDLNDADPKAVSNETQKIKLGVVDQIRKSARGIEAHFALDNDGAKAVTEEGYKYPSAFWWVLPNGKRGDAILAKPFKLISVALTPYPNISGVESLANARLTEPAARQNEPKKENTMKSLLIGWLAAQGLVLANDASDSSVLEAFQKHVSGQAASLTALGNEKSTLGGKITALENDVKTEKARADQNATALSNEQTARKVERKGRAEAIADLAIHRGIKTIAEREATVTALENSADFTKAAEDLLKQQATRTTTTNGRDASGKQSAALENDQATALRDYQTAFAVELPLANQDPVKAHRAVMVKHPSLAEKLQPKKA